MEEEVGSVNYGYIPSVMDGSEYQFKLLRGFEVPSRYSYQKYLPEVINQKDRPICVPCSISAFINWNKNLEDGDNKLDHKVDLEEIYASRTHAGDDGMSFKDAFRYLRHNGVKTDFGNYKIARYAQIGSILQLKQALVVNGPCVAALPVYDGYRSDFWRKLMGDTFLGGHAVSVAGYSEKGFLIRNSWGKGYGDKGYSILPYSEFEQFREIWTIIDK